MYAELIIKESISSIILSSEEEDEEEDKVEIFYFLARSTGHVCLL